MLGTSTGGHSADGRWWWNGVSWQPAFSRDGQSWWNGAQWLPVARPPWGRACVIVGSLVAAIALASLSVLGLVAMGDPVNGEDANPRWLDVAIVVAIAGLAVGIGLLVVGIVRLTTRRSPTRAD